MAENETINTVTKEDQAQAPRWVMLMAALKGKTRDRPKVKSMAAGTALLMATPKAGGMATKTATPKAMRMNTIKTTTLRGLKLV